MNLGTKGLGHALARKQGLVETRAAHRRATRRIALPIISRSALAWLS